MGLSNIFVYPAISGTILRSEDPVARVRRLGEVSTIFAAAISFIAGWYLCLPESEFVELPIWARKIAVGPNVLIHEALFAAFLTVGGLGLILRSAIRERYLTLAPAITVVLLALWCGTASLLAPLPAHDLGRSARLVTMSLFLLGVTHWAASNPLLVLRAFLLGLIGGSAINLLLTFQNPVVAGLIPRLLGQNAPGPPMGIAVNLAAWLILLSRSRRDTLLALSAALICGVGAAISYSKTGMLAAIMGFVSIALVSGRVSPSKRGRLLIITLFGIVLGAASYVNGPRGIQILGAFTEMVREKVESASDESVSIQQRVSYWKGVTEIATKHPFGVGFSGFRDAMMRTDAYATGLAADETLVGPADSNPHAFFLYYLSAGGFVGGLLAAGALVLLGVAMVRGLGMYGPTGALLALFCCVAYFVLATSIPYMLNSGVMLIPAGIAAGIYSHVRRASVRA